MITERGRVVAIEADCLWIETIRKSTCNSCAAQKGCGHGLMNKRDNNRRHYVRALLGEVPAETFKLDDMVEISIPEHVLIAALLLVYGLPLILMLGGALLANLWQPGDLFAVLGAITGFVLGFAVVNVHAWLNSNNQTLQPVVVAPCSSRLKPPVKTVHPA